MTSTSRSVQLIKLCSQHSMEALRFLCRTCDVELCLDCLINNLVRVKHAGHKLVEIDEEILWEELKDDEKETSSWGEIRLQFENLPFNWTEPDDEEDYVIMITHVISPSHFFFVYESHREELNRLKGHIQSIVNNPNSHLRDLDSLAELRPGHFILAKFTDNCWYRAKVVELGGGSKLPKSVKVQLVDYGQKCDCKLTEIKVPSRQLLLHETPSFVYEGAMMDVIPKHGQPEHNQWTEDAIMRFEDLVKERRFFVQRCQKDRQGGGKLLMDLYECEKSIDGIELYYDFSASVSESMLFTQHSTFKDRRRNPLKTTTAAANIMHAPMPYSVRQETPAPPFASDVKYKVAVCAFENTSEFYCRVLEARERKQQKILFCEIEYFVGRFLNRPEIGVMCPYAGMYCLAKYEVEDSSAFYRAIVLETRLNGDIRVFFIDFGNTEIVKLDEIRKIPLSFLTDYPSVLMKCKFANIGAFSLGKEFWDDYKIDDVKKMILNRTGRVRVESCDKDGLYTVELFLPNWKTGELESVAHVMTEVKKEEEEATVSLASTSSVDPLGEHSDSDSGLEGRGGKASGGTTTPPSFSSSNDAITTTTQSSPAQVGSAEWLLSSVSVRRGREVLPQVSAASHSVSELLATAGIGSGALEAGTSEVNKLNLHSDDDDDELKRTTILDKQNKVFLPIFCGKVIVEEEEEKILCVVCSLNLYDLRQHNLLLLIEVYFKCSSQIPPQQLSFESLIKEVNVEMKVLQMALQKASLFAQDRSSAEEKVKYKQFMRYLWVRMRDSLHCQQITRRKKKDDCCSMGQLVHVCDQQSAPVPFMEEPCQVVKVGMDSWERSILLDLAVCMNNIQHSFPLLFNWDNSNAGKQLETAAVFQAAVEEESCLNQLSTLSKL